MDLSTGTTATQFTTGTSSKVEHSPACCYASKGAYWREDAAFGGLAIPLFDRQAAHSKGTAGRFTRASA